MQRGLEYNYKMSHILGKIIRKAKMCEVIKFKMVKISYFGKKNLYMRPQVARTAIFLNNS